MSEEKIAVLDLAPAHEDFQEQVVAGLSQTPRMLPSKFFYDEIGSALFLKICELPEYYVTRTEMSILRARGPEIARTLGRGIELIGLGTGAGTKTRLLLDHLDAPVAYLPVDISREQLAQSTSAFSREFPSLQILPVCADYLEPFDLPTPLRTPTEKVVYFPGSTIGNLEPQEAQAFLEKITTMAETDGRLLIGVDLKKEKAILEHAYDDEAGVTAKFNLNLLARANRELKAGFDLARWHHHAFYNDAAGRIEMHLVSEAKQAARVGEQNFAFERGEHIITEFSYKYSPSEFIAMADSAGMRFEKLWTDDSQWFGLFLFAVKDRA